MRKSHRWTFWISALLTAAVFMTLAGWTWHACPHPLVDFGRECYAPWRISQGEHLYRDLVHFNGPLSQYFNGLIFTILGPSVTALKIVNVVIAALTLGMIFWIAMRLCDTWAALVCGGVFCAVFAFNHSGAGGAANFNWLTPYSHELTHGIALSLAMLICLWRGIEFQKHGWIGLGGGWMGLVLLTKAEVMLAAMLAGGTMLGVGLLHSRVRWRSVAPVFLTAMVAPVLVAFALLTAMSDAQTALRGLAGSWLHVGNDRLLGMTFFRWMSGSDDYGHSVTLILLWTLLYGAGVLVAVGVSLRARGRVIGFISILAAAVGFGWIYFAWVQRWVSTGAFLRPLPLVLVGLAWWMLFRLRHGVDQIAALSLIVFSGALLPKILLNTQANHYGFALAMPGTMMAMILLQKVARERLLERQWIVRAMLLGMLAMPLWIVIRLDARNLEARNAPLGEGADQFLVDPDLGAPLSLLLREIAHRSSADHTLVVMPDGLMVNYLSRRRLPGRQYHWSPPGLMMFSEQAMLGELQASAPDWIVLAHYDAQLYDARWFGKDYAQSLNAWVALEYQPVAQIGATPFESDAFGVVLLRRTTP